MQVKIEFGDYDFETGDLGKVGAAVSALLDAAQRHNVLEDKRDEKDQDAAPPSIPATIDESPVATQTPLTCVADPEPVPVVKKKRKRRTKAQIAADKAAADQAIEAAVEAVEEAAEAVETARTEEEGQTADMIFGEPATPADPPTLEAAKAAIISADARLRAAEVPRATTLIINKMEELTGQRLLTDVDPSHFGDLIAALSTVGT